MPKSRYKKTNAKYRMLKLTHMPKLKCERNVNMIYQVTNTQRKSWNIKKTKESEYVTVPKQFKKMNFKMEFFSSLLVTINTEVIIFNIRLSIVTKLNLEIRAVVLSAHARLRFNLSMSLLLGAFHLVYLRKDTKNGSSRPWTY